MSADTNGRSIVGPSRVEVGIRPLSPHPDLDSIGSILKTRGLLAERERLEPRL